MYVYIEGIYGVRMHVYIQEEVYMYVYVEGMHVCIGVYVRIYSRLEAGYIKNRNVVCVCVCVCMCVYIYIHVYVCVGVWVCKCI
jgi:hypothetical protein